MAAPAEQHVAVHMQHMVGIGRQQAVEIGMERPAVVGLFRVFNAGREISLPDRVARGGRIVDFNDVDFWETPRDSFDFRVAKRRLRLSS